MKEKHLLIAVVILLGLVLYYSFFEYHGSSQEGMRKGGPPLLFLRPGEVKKVEIKSLKEGELIGELKGKGWSLVKGNAVENWEAKLGDFIVDCLTMVEIEKFPVENSQLKDYGLENPAYQITLTDVTDKTYQILIGDRNPARSCVYVKFADSPLVIKVGAFLSFALQKIAPLLVSAS